MKLIIILHIFEDFGMVVVVLVVLGGWGGGGGGGGGCFGLRQSHLCSVIHRPACEWCEHDNSRGTGWIVIKSGTLIVIVPRIDHIFKLIGQSSSSEHQNDDFGKFQNFNSSPCIHHKEKIFFTISNLQTNSFRIDLPKIGPTYKQSTLKFKFKILQFYKFLNFRSQLQTLT